MIFLEKIKPRHRRGLVFVLYFLNNVFDNREEALERSDVKRLVGRMEIKHDRSAGDYIKRGQLLADYSALKSCVDGKHARLLAK
jgi:hypothetical protein